MRKAARPPRQNILYADLAPWWPLCSAPEDYREESEIYRKALLANSARKPRTLLELGSGGGNNASHLKTHFKMTLVDLSPGMLAVSRALNPECEHVRGDMRRVRLDRLFDGVFVHDAIDYMTTLTQLRQAVATAYVHCRAGGVALFVPDWTADRFRSTSSHGGHDRGSKGLRYLEWIIDHDPHDGRYTLYMSYLLREGKRVRQVALDVHQCGLFSEADWLGTIRDVGFVPKTLAYGPSNWERHAQVMFVGTK
jgi:SAM-dependent methyltransferase